MTQTMQGRINVTVVSMQARIPEEKGAAIEYSGSVSAYPEITRGLSEVDGR